MSVATTCKITTSVYHVSNKIQKPSYQALHSVNALYQTASSTCQTKWQHYSWIRMMIGMFIEDLYITCDPQASKVALGNSFYSLHLSGKWNKGNVPNDVKIQCRQVSSQQQSTCHSRVCSLPVWQQAAHTTSLLQVQLPDERRLSPPMHQFWNIILVIVYDWLTQLLLLNFVLFIWPKMFLITADLPQNKNF